MSFNARMNAPSTPYFRSCMIWSIVRESIGVSGRSPWPCLKENSISGISISGISMSNSGITILGTMTGGIFTSMSGAITGSTSTSGESTPAIPGYGGAFGGPTFCWACTGLRIARGTTMHATRDSVSAVPAAFRSLWRTGSRMDNRRPSSCEYRAIETAAMVDHSAFRMPLAVCSRVSA